MTRADSRRFFLKKRSNQIIMRRILNVLMIVAALAVALPISAQEMNDGKKPKKEKKEKVEKVKKDKKDKNGKGDKKDHDCNKCEEGNSADCCQDKGKSDATPDCCQDKGQAAIASDDMTVPFVLDKPILKTDGDSIAYQFGVANSNGLEQYVTNQLGVTPEYFDYFYNGMMARATVDDTDKARIAYLKGLLIGDQIEQMSKGVSKQYYGNDDERMLSKSIITAGIIEGMTGMSSISIQEANTHVREILNDRQKVNTEREKAKADADEKAFLSENAKKPGVVTLPSGLQYKVLVEGNGAIPKATDKVKVNYEGHLIDGTEFDSSYKRKEPTSFNCNQVIKGWTEALCLMPVGSKWELYIPYALAYGERSTGNIPPYSTLTFTVELLSIEK